MATISNQTLKIENVDATTVKVTVGYTLTPTNIEKLAGTVFSEKIQIVGDDAGTATDLVIATLPDFPYAVSTATGTVTRNRPWPVLKAHLNEDPEFTATGAEVNDEIFARITVTYAAAAPTVPTLPPPVVTSTISGAWK